LIPLMIQNVQIKLCFLPSVYGRNKMVKTFVYLPYTRVSFYQKFHASNLVKVVTINSLVKEPFLHGTKCS
jgi:hypothetical protein